MSQMETDNSLVSTTLMSDGMSSQEDQLQIPTAFVKRKSTKDYSDTTRMFDMDGFRLRADAICFSDKLKTKVLLVSSRNWVGQWTIPGGGLEPDETIEQAALREAMEEGGVEGQLYEFVGSFDNEINKTRTKVFTMIVSREVLAWKDNRQICRKRRWFTKEEAVSMLKIRSPVKCRYLELACFSTSDVVYPTVPNGKNPAVKINNVSSDSSNSDVSNSAHDNGSCQASSCSHNVT